MPIVAERFVFNIPLSFLWFLFEITVTRIVTVGELQFSPRFFQFLIFSRSFENRTTIMATIFLVRRSPHFESTYSSVKFFMMQNPTKKNYERTHKIFCATMAENRSFMLNFLAFGGKSRNY